MTDDELLDVALRVTDGSPVDWAALAGRLAPDDHLPLARIRQIHVIAQVCTSAAPAFSAIHDSISAVAADEAATPVHWGPLEIRQKIGRGSYGDVYLARDTRLGRDVALKLLRRRDATPDLASTLVREGHLISRVRHPNVVTVYGAERIDGRAGLWMEFVQGETLDQELRRNGPVPESEAVRIGVDLSRALGAVHAAGLLHRDIKAQNVMRAKDGRVVLMDFGTGHDASDTESASGLAGTPLYLAPELLAGGMATVRTDVYAVGVLLWHAATSTYPAIGSTTAEIRAAHARRPPAGDAPAGVSRAFGDVLTRATAVDPLDRYPDAAALEGALAALTRIDSARGRRLALVATLLLVALGAAGARLLWTARQSPFASATPVTPASPAPPSRSVPQPSAAPPGPADDPRVTSSAEPPSASPPPGPSPSATPTLASLHENLRENINLRSGSLDPRLATCTPVGRNGVAICDLVTGEVRPLRIPSTPTLERSSSAVLSPNGELVAYLWSEGPVSASTTTLRVMAVDGTDDRELYKLDEPGRMLGIFDWTSGSDAVLASVPRGAETHAVLFPLDGAPPRTVRRASFQERALSADLSPHGPLLLTASLDPAVHEDALHVRVMDTATGVEWPVMAPDARAYGPRWTPDGDGIVFASDRLGAHALFLQRMAGGKPLGEPALVRELSRSRIRIIGAARDGSLLLTLLAGVWDVFRAPIDFTAGVLGARQRATRSSEASQSAQWSGSGRQFAYMVGAIGASPPAARIVLRDREGGREREFPLPGSVVPNHAMLRWSPDDSQLAVVTLTAAPEGFRAVHVLSLATGATRMLESTLPALDVAWADADHLFVSRPDGIQRVALADGAAVPVYRPVPPWRVHRFAVAPDGRFAVVEDYRQVQVTCAVRIVERGTARDRQVVPDSRCEAVKWSPDGRHVLAVTSEPVRNRAATLWIMHAAGGTPSRIRVPGEPIVDLSVSPDGRELLFTAGNPRPEQFRFSGFLPPESTRR